MRAAVRARAGWPGTGLHWTARKLELVMGLDQGCWLLLGLGQGRPGIGVALQTARKLDQRLVRE